MIRGPGDSGCARGSCARWLVAEFELGVRLGRRNSYDGLVMVTLGIRLLLPGSTMPVVDDGSVSPSSALQERRQPLRVRCWGLIPARLVEARACLHRAGQPGRRPWQLALGVLL